MKGAIFIKGSQSHLNYLSESHTDFIFPTMAEEWGMVEGSNGFAHQSCDESDFGRLSLFAPRRQR